MAKIVISISEPMLDGINMISKSERVSRSKVICRALRMYLAKAFRSENLLAEIKALRIPFRSTKEILMLRDQGR